MTTESKIKPWQKIEEKLLQQTCVFELYAQQLRSPSGKFQDEFYYLNFVDWVNIIAITPQDEVVLVEQFRFGIHQNTLEVPGGMLNRDEQNPMAAALRELEEETGYSAKTAEPLGYVHPNPALQTNRCYSYFARNVELTQSQNLDPAEDICVHLVPLADIPQLIAKERITHSLVVCAFFRFFAQHPAAFSR